MKKIIFIVLVLFVSGIGGYWYHKQSQQQQINTMIIVASQFDIQHNNFLQFSKDYIEMVLGHYKKNRRTKTVYYLPMQGNEKRKNIITGADYASFTSVDLQWARDKNYYYLDGKKTDVQTNYHPKLLGAGGRIVDDNAVYDGGGKLSTGIDRKTFQLLGNWGRYAKDKNNIYIGTNIFTGVDYNSFQGLNSTYGKDKNNVYHGRKIITGADTISFESLFPPVLDNKKEDILYDAKDNIHYYKNGKVVIL